MGWTEALIPPSATVHAAISAIDAGSLQICLVVDEDRRLLGTVTDGDIRRAILQGTDMDVPVESIMNRSPQVAGEGESEESILARMTTALLRQMPVLGPEGRVVDVVHIKNLLSPSVHPRENWVVLMAGGQGMRLRPLTEDKPKPLLPVGNKPLLETIMESFIGQNFRRFYISVNYKADMIKEHFDDGGKWDVEIRYIEEEKRMGTAGALRFIPERPEAPLIIMNGDLLTRVDFLHMLDYHHQHASSVTMCVREYDFQVPFGVVQIEDNRIKSIAEKPIHRFFINAGIYVLESHIIDLIPAGEAFDMPALFERVIEAGHDTAAFPIREYWLDVGRISDFDQARGDYDEIFEK